MKESNTQGKELNPQEIEDLLTRLRESIDIYESKPSQYHKTESVIEQLNATDETSGTDVSVSLDEVSLEETSIIEDKPVFEEASTVEDKPVFEEEPIVEDQSISEEEPIVEDEIFSEEDPHVGDEPLSEEEPNVANTDSFIVQESLEEESAVEEASEAEMTVDEEDDFLSSDENIEAVSLPFESSTVSDQEPEEDEDDLISKINLDELIGLDNDNGEEQKRPHHRYKAVISRPSASSESEKMSESETTEEATEVEVPDAAEMVTSSTGKAEQGEIAKQVDDTVPFQTVQKVKFVVPVRTEADGEKTSILDEENTLSGAATASSVDYSDFHIADPAARGSGNARVEEFVSKEQADQINRQYMNERKAVFARLLVTGILSLFLFLADALMLFGVPLEKIFKITAYPFVLPLISLQFLFVCIALTQKQIQEGAQALIEHKAVPETYYLTAEIWIVAYGIFACLQYDVLRRSFTFMPLLTVLGCTLSFFVLLSEFLCLTGQHASFRTISQPGDKLAAEIARVSARPEEYRLLRNTGATRAIHVKKVEFIDGYFRQMNRRVEDFNLNFWILIAINAAALLLFVIVGFAISGVVPVLGALVAAVCLFVSAPFSFYFAHRYPVYRAAKIAADEHCAFVGESAVQMYSLADVMVFEDVEAFTAANTRICRIKLPTGVQVHQVLYYLTKAFGVIGGPLFGLFNTATEGIDDYSDTKLISSEKNGLHVRVGMKDVHIGRASYLTKNGIAPYYEEEDGKYREEGKISLMYVAVGGVFMAKFYIRYEPSAKFCRNAARLAKHGMHLLIRTFDPNIDDELLSKHPLLSKLPIKIVHKSPEQLHDYAESRIYSGLVTSGSTKDILKLMLLCDNVKTVQTLARTGKILAAAIGVLVPFVLALTGNLPFLLSPFSILYWLLWSVPLALLTKRKL